MNANVNLWQQKPSQTFSKFWKKIAWLQSNLFWSSILKDPREKGDLKFVDLLTSGIAWIKVGRKRFCQNVKKEIQTKVLDPTMNKISVK